MLGHLLCKAMMHVTISQCDSILTVQTLNTYANMQTPYRKTNSCHRPTVFFWLYGKSTYHCFNVNPMFIFVFFLRQSEFNCLVLNECKYWL